MEKVDPPESIGFRDNRRSMFLENTKRLPNYFDPPAKIVTPGISTGDASPVRKGKEGTPYHTADGTLLWHRDEVSGNACIVGCEPESPVFHVPSTINGLPVEVIGERAFSYCNNLDEVVLPDTVVVLSRLAFVGSPIKRFVAPPSLRAIHEKAFFSCYSLKEVQLNEGLLRIEDFAFGQSGVSGVMLPASLEYLGHSVFKDTATLKEGSQGIVVHPDSTNVYIDDQQALYVRTRKGVEFRQVLDPNIRELHVMPGTTVVGSFALSNHPSLEYVELPEGVRHIQYEAFMDTPNLVCVDVPSTLVSIGSRAFLNSGLETFHIPAALEKIGIDALTTGTHRLHGKPATLRELTVDPANPRFSLSDEGLLMERMDNGKVKSVVYGGPGGVVHIPDEVSGIGPSTFAGVTTVRELFLHDHIEAVSVDSFAFRHGLLLIHGADEKGSVDIHIPDSPAGAKAVVTAFHDAYVNLDRLAVYADEAILAERNSYTLCRMMVERLEEPVRLSPASREQFEHYLMRNTIGAALNFARNGYLKGIDSLKKLGYIREDDIDELVNRLSEEGEVAAVNHVLSMRGNPTVKDVLFDFDL